jgi:hypothetical protein
LEVLRCVGRDKLFGEQCKTTGVAIGVKLLIALVGAGRFELSTPVPQTGILRSTGRQASGKHLASPGALKPAKISISGPPPATEGNSTHLDKPQFFPYVSPCQREGRGFKSLRPLQSLLETGHRSALHPGAKLQNIPDGSVACTASLWSCCAVSANTAANRKALKLYHVVI